MNVTKIDNKYFIEGTENEHTQDVLENGWLIIGDSQVLFELNYGLFIFDLSWTINEVRYTDINDFVQALL